MRFFSLAKLFRRLPSRKTKKTVIRRPRRCIPFLERLEPRWLPTIFTVTNTNDSGTGSLRQAILDANSNVGADTIQFSIATGSQTINVLSALPTITDTVTIDATTQPGYAGTPIIELAGSSAGSANGLVLTASNSSVKGLVIDRFSGDGIILTGGASADVIQGNYIGTNVAGTAALANTQTGIALFNIATNNTIGGTTAGTGNVISGNLGSGVSIDGFGGPASAMSSKAT